MSEPDTEIANILRLALASRRAMESRWISWKRLSGHPSPDRLPSEDVCIPSSFAMSLLLQDRVPAYRWRVCGGRPTKRTPAGGYLDGDGKPRPHLWTLGSNRKRRLIVDVTADQFGGPEALVSDAADAPYRANATPRLLAYYARCEAATVDWLVAVCKAEIGAEDYPDGSSDKRGARMSAV